jgi:hypothetical protein
MIRNSLIASAVAATIASTGLVAASPALAGGSVSYTYTPTTPQQALALQRGLQMYSYYSAAKANGGVIRQYGTGNIAGLGQSGSGNLGVIYQQGSNHSATLTQTGNNNTYGIFQFGNGGSTNVAQTGNGQVGVTFQRSW